MKRLIFIVTLLLGHFYGHASHIVGGEMYYDCLGGNQYQVTVKLYRDCFSTGAAYDANLPITVFDGSGTQIDNFTIPFPGSSDVPPTFSNPCVTIPPDICVEEAIYTQAVTLPASANGYTLTYQRCCRGPDVMNLNTPEDQGITLTVDIPPNNLAPCNSSPRFDEYPPLVLCANDELVFDHSATDPDGDLLVYELCDPFIGGTSGAPAPNPASPPPYQTVNWIGGISATNPFGNGSITIDANSGLMIAAPEQEGLFAVGVCVHEYRNGNHIGTTRRDFLFKVFNCEIEMAAEVVQQEDLSTFVSYCEGLTITFENSSFGGTNYLWDFGVDGINTDVSTEFAPTYTYPSPGTYEVMLVVNPGWTCTDTAYGTFILQEEIDATFSPPPPQCVLDNSFNFQGDGVYPASGTSFLWEFGEFANPDSAFVENPAGIVYSQSGIFDVTFTVTYDVCSASHTEEVKVTPPPTIQFSILDELKCAPYTAEFVNLSTAGTTIFSAWDFGDGTTSSSLHPTHVYEEPGVYDVSLTIWTEEGCIDTLDLLKTNYIEIFPSPTSAFSVSPTEQDEYHADFYFTDESIDAIDVEYHFGDGSWDPFDNGWYNYTEPGVYHPYQIAENEYGCRDISYQMLTVTPLIPVLVPNAFTPDGDQLNNVFQPVWYDNSMQFEMWIYNRWGENIFYSNEPNAYWDGSANGQLVPEGVYVWTIKYIEYDTGLPKEISGHVVVLR